MPSSPDTAAAPLSQTPQPMPRVAAPPGNTLLALFAISVVGLFLELLLIRWVSTEIRIFAYLQNTVLVVCFLGLGMGCWDCKKPFALRHILVPLTILVGLLAVPTSRLALGGISDMLSGVSGFTIWEGESSNETILQRIAAPVMGIVLTLALTVLLWDIFVPVGRLLGRLMADAPNPVRAYSVNVAGSLAGIWLYVALSGFSLPPVCWFAAFAVGCLYFVGTGGGKKWLDGALLAAILGFSVLAGIEPGWQEVKWSPYQKLALMEFGKDEPTIWAGLRGARAPSMDAAGTHFIAVNNAGYQVMIDLRPATVDADSKKFPPAQKGYSQYDLPPRLHPNPKSMLIVGAGSGNDAAGALRNGVQNVVAVDIDPAIIDFGKRHHPEQPYSDPKVRVVNDDARSYFATCTEKFDVIAFGLLDSHTTTAMTNARLDHYVYTRESLAHAKTLLNPGGVLVLSFEAQKPFIADRMAKGLEDVFGRRPDVFKVPHNAYGWGGVMFVAGDLDAAHARIAEQPKLATLIDGWKNDLKFALPGTTEVPTDDWPYLYQETRSVPVLYFVLAAALALLFARGVRTLGVANVVRGWDRGQTHFALLGAAFMLLEVQNISKASVVLGNTWIVNAVIISGILCMILLANALSGVVSKLPPAVVYVGLVGSCLGLYFLDLSRFGFLPYTTKALLVGALTSLPMLFSGLVFIRSFAAAERKDAALGANLLGSLAGGLLQTVTFITGIKALLVIVAGLYVVALLTRPRRAVTAAA